ncbi:MAG: lysine--tRNA ligase [Gemmatimonadetes bacterium]|nr:MAG: lysine--tRNA ligase [Gemmatimonadota bacterium]
MTSFVEAARREKLAELVKRGVVPFAYRFDRTGSIQAALERYRDADPTVHRLAGRLILLRSMGKTTFGHLEDRSGKIQVYFKIDAVGAEPYELVKLLDLGDVIGVEGPLFRTKTGEVTVRVERFTLLTKSLRPLPLGKEDAEGKRHGELSDPELRARQRYADLAVHPEVRDVFQLRARAIAYLRKFLDARGYLEVETPVLQPVYGGASARPFITHYEALDTNVYLRIADQELFGTTTLERHGATLDFKRPFARKDYYALVREAAGIDLASAGEGELRAALKRKDVADADQLSGAKLVDEVFKSYVEPTLVQPTFVLDYPVALSPLAKLKRGDPTRVERWELFIQKREIANAFSELNDPEEQRRRFEQQARLRAAGDAEAQQLDEDFIRALEYGMPPTGGVGLGLDRLQMILADQSHIRDVILFPMLRPE